MSALKHLTIHSIVSRGDIEEPVEGVEIIETRHGEIYRTTGSKETYEELSSGYQVDGKTQRYVRKVGEK